MSSLKDSGSLKEQNKALLEKIEALEKRVRELEARPIYWPCPIYYPVFAPAPPLPTWPLQPYWWPAMPPPAWIGASVSASTGADAPQQTWSTPGTTFTTTAMPNGSPLTFSFSSNAMSGDFSSVCVPSVWSTPTDS